MSLNYESIIKQMSLEEKALMMTGKNTWETVDFEKYGIPSMAMSDGPHGLRRQAGAGDHLGLNASLPATCFPTAASVANSWDETLGEEIGTALAVHGSDAFKWEIVVHHREHTFLHLSTVPCIDDNLLFGCNVECNTCL